MLYGNRSDTKDLLFDLVWPVGARTRAPAE